jgi:hypothetical protein
LRRESSSRQSVISRGSKETNSFMPRKPLVTSRSRRAWKRVPQSGRERREWTTSRTSLQRRTCEVFSEEGNGGGGDVGRVQRKKESCRRMDKTSGWGSSSRVKEGCERRVKKRARSFFHLSAADNERRSGEGGPGDDWALIGISESDAETLQSQGDEPRGQGW